MSNERKFFEIEKPASDRPVRTWYSTLNVKAQAYIDKKLIHFAQLPDLYPPHIEKLDGYEVEGSGDIFELRMKQGSEYYRIYMYRNPVDKNDFVFCHAIKKKQKKAKASDLKRAKLNMKEYIDGISTIHEVEW